MALNAPALRSELLSTFKGPFVRPTHIVSTPVFRRHAFSNSVRARQEKAIQGERIQHNALPDFMISVPVRALGLQSISPHSLSGSNASGSLFSILRRGATQQTSPLTRHLQNSARAFSTATFLDSSSLRAPQRTSFLGFAQRRTLFKSSGTSHNLLASLEQTANNQPGNANAQNAFYQALLRANMAHIVVERHQTGRYASNAAVDAAYARALTLTGSADASAAGLAAGQNSRLSPEMIQAIGSAVTAKTHGGNVGVVKAGNGMGSGAKGEPIYVVVDESLRSTIFKWVKFTLIFGVVVYLTLVLFTLLVEATGMMKKVGGAQSAEAKPEHQKQRFTDVHGCDEAKEELQELIEFLRNPDQFSALGGKLPKGVLLVGPPGTGKTLLARAVAGEAGVPFFYMSGSEFDEVFVGVGAKRVRELFNAARAKSPSIIFIDELDAIGAKRNDREAAYIRQTLNQLLTEMDGFDQNSRVIIIGATNFPQSLDKALTRPGRFDRNITVELPDVRGRIAILKHYMKGIRVDASADPAIIARGCPGFSGAELENIVNQAAVRASKNKQQKVTLEDLVWAKDKILLGAERRSAVIQQKDKLMTAYHEGGHALVAMMTEAANPLYKATIMPRGHALGVTMQLPEIDKVSETKKELMAQIDICMGGKVAEELIYGAENVTTGASSDIQSATRIAYSMVTQAGMSETLGNIDLSSNYARLSSETKQKIEDEVRRLVEDGRERAYKVLTEHRDGLERLALALVEYETLNRDEMERVVRGEKLDEKLKTDPSAPVKIPEPILTPKFGLPPGIQTTPPPRSVSDGSGESRPHPAGSS